MKFMSDGKVSVAPIFNVVSDPSGARYVIECSISGLRTTCTRYNPSVDNRGDVANILRSSELLMMQGLCPNSRVRDDKLCMSTALHDLCIPPRATERNEGEPPRKS